MNFRNLAIFAVLLAGVAWGVAKFSSDPDSAPNSASGDGQNNQTSAEEGSLNKGQQSLNSSNKSAATSPTIDIPPADDLHVKLQQKDIKIGSGKQASEGRRVQVHAIMKLSDGKVVFDTYSQGQPWDGVVGDGRFIKGLDQGIRGMFVGGKRSLWIPSYLAFGAFGISPQVPPNSKIYAEIELMSVF